MAALKRIYVKDITVQFLVASQLAVYDVLIQVDLQHHGSSAKAVVIVSLVQMNFCFMTYFRIQFNTLAVVELSAKYDRQLSAATPRTAT